MTFSALIEITGADKKVRKHWTPMYPGGRNAARKEMLEDPRITECSIYTKDGSRFIGTEYPKENN